jgi:hypothetical protein
MGTRRIVTGPGAAVKGPGGAGTKNAAQTEAKLRDLFAVLCRLAGAAPEELAFMYHVPPDGSRVAGLRRLLERVELYVGGLRLRLRLEGKGVGDA